MCNMYIKYAYMKYIVYLHALRTLAHTHTRNIHRHTHITYIYIYIHIHTHTLAISQHAV